MDVIKNVVGRVALGANKYVGVEAIRGDMRWSTFKEIVMKRIMNYKIRLERMPHERRAKKVYEWDAGKSRWGMQCKRVARECELKTKNVIGFNMRDKGCCSYKITGW